MSNGGLVTMMRHRSKLNRLGRPADQRKALLRSLTTEVLRHGRIKTTTAKVRRARAGSASAARCTAVVAPGSSARSGAPWADGRARPARELAGGTLHLGAPD